MNNTKSLTKNKKLFDSIHFKIGIEEHEDAQYGKCDVMYIVAK